MARNGRQSIDLEGVLTPSGGRRKGAGRPKAHDKPTTRRHVYLSADVYIWLARNGNASAEIERLAREAMSKEAKPDE